MGVDPEFMKWISQETMQATMNATIAALKKHRMLKTGKDSAFIRTEKLLYNYTRFKALVQTKFKEIETLETEGLQRTSKSLVTLPQSNTIDTYTDLEKVETKIEGIGESIKSITRYIAQIDGALDKIRDDPYFGIIKMKYFEECSHEKIAGEFEVDVSTITRNKNRLIDTLKIYLFPDDSVFELFE